MEKPKLVNRIEYKCIKCGHEDALKWWMDDPQSPPVMLTCTSPKCRAGMNKPIEYMIQAGEGMAPKTPSVPVLTH